VVGGHIKLRASNALVIWLKFVSGVVMFTYANSLGVAGGQVS
jgi:hypothetical protein